MLRQYGRNIGYTNSREKTVTRKNPEELEEEISGLTDEKNREAYQPNLKLSLML